MTIENRNSLLLLRMAFAVAALAIYACLCACTPKAEKPAGPVDKVTMAVAAAPDTALAQVALVDGFFQKEGLEVTPLKYEYGKLALEAMLEGKADFATVAETPVMFACMKGAKISVIAAIQQSNGNNAIIARRDRGILSPSDLKGRKIGTTSGTILDYYLDSFLAANGISRKAVTLVDMRPEQMAAAIDKGAVDAISAWSHVTMETRRRLGAREITFQDRDIYTQTFLVVAGQEFIRNNPEKVRRMLRALLRAEDFVRKNPTEAQAVVADFCGIDRAVIGELWGLERFAVTLDQMLILALEDESRWAKKNGLTDAVNIPNYLNYIYLDGLGSVRPEAVRIIR